MEHAWSEKTVLFSLCVCERHLEEKKGWRIKELKTLWDGVFPPVFTEFIHKHNKFYKSIFLHLPLELAIPLALNLLKRVCTDIFFVPMQGKKICFDNIEILVT